MTVHETQRNRLNTAFSRPLRRSSSRTSAEGKRTKSMKAIPPTPITAALRWTHCANVAITCPFCSGCGEKQAILRLGFRQLVDLPREVEILLGDAAFAVRGKRDAHHVVVDCNVGMVSGLFSEFGDLVHQ